MTTYYLTFALVAYFGAMAQYCDRGFVPKNTWGRVKHSIPTLVFYVLAAAVLIIVAGLRYRVGTDFGGYYGVEVSPQDLIRRWTTLDEPGFFTLAFLAYALVPVKVSTTFVASLVTIGVTLIVIYRNTDSLFVCLLLFMLLGTWHGGFNGVRQYLAVAVLFAGYPYLRDKKLVPFLLCVAVAFLFHRSVICMVLLYPIAHIEVNARNVTILVVGSIVVLFSYDRVLAFTGWVLNSGVADTKEGDDGYAYIASSVNVLRVAVGCMPAVLGLWYYWKKQKDDRLTFCLNMALARAVLEIASSGSAYLARIVIYTDPFLLMVLPELLKPLPKKYRSIATAVMLALYACFTWYEIWGSGSLNHWQWAFGR